MKPTWTAGEDEEEEEEEKKSLSMVEGDRRASAGKDLKLHQFWRAAKFPMVRPGNYLGAGRLIKMGGGVWGGAVLGVKCQWRRGVFRS
jgi:hypothetical protein